MKLKQERFTETVEASIDAEFVNIGINTFYVCYLKMQQAPATTLPGTVCAMTVVSADEMCLDEVVSAVKGIQHELEIAPPGTYATRYMFQSMCERGFPGVSICSCGDRFKMREGRIRAKRRLLSHLMHQSHIIITLDKHRALYPVSPTINEVQPDKEVIPAKQNTKKPIHTLDDAVGVEEECRYLQAKIQVHELRSTLDRLEEIPDAVTVLLEDRANKIVTLDRLIVALRKDVDDRDGHIRDLMSTVARQRKNNELEGGEQ